MSPSSGPQFRYSGSTSRPSLRPKNRLWLLPPSLASGRFPMCITRTLYPYHIHAENAASVFFRNGSNTVNIHTGPTSKKRLQHQNCIIARTKIVNNALLLSHKEDTKMRSALCWDITQCIVTVPDV